MVGVNRVIQLGYLEREDLWDLELRGSVQEGLLSAQYRVLALAYDSKQEWKGIDELIQRVLESGELESLGCVERALSLESAEGAWSGESEITVIVCHHLTINRKILQSARGGYTFLELELGLWHLDFDERVGKHRYIMLVSYGKSGGCFQLLLVSLE